MHARCGRCRIPAARRNYWLAKLTRNKLRDRKNRRRLQRQGWRVLTLWECQLQNPKRLTQKLQRFLTEP